MRLPYAPITPDPSSSESTKEIYTKIAARRSPRPIQKLDLALLHNPSIANGWNELLGAIRTQSSLSQAVMEFAICRIAVLNKAVYEWSAHAPLAVKAGVTREVLQALIDLPERTTVLGGQEKDSEGGLAVLDEVQQVVLAYTDAMTRQVEVGEDTFEALKRHFSETEVVELTATVATYNCVSRFLVALDVCEMNGLKIEVPE